MQNLLDPAILFFIFGVLAGFAKSNLEIPQAISRFLSLYLLMALGLKGGFALAHSGFNSQIVLSLGAALCMAVIVPLVGYWVLRTFVGGFDAAAIAATYGSVSAVTFLTATQYLENQHIAYGGHMAAAMALMESPAIIMAVVFANKLRQRALGRGTRVSDSTAARVTTATKPQASLGNILHESFTDGAQMLLLGAMVIGLITGDSGKAAMQPFSGDLFKGMLSFFLLDMGLTAARNMPQLKEKSRLLLAYALVGPIVHASLALGLACMLDLPPGEAALLMVLAASASCIAVPAVLRYAMPEANPTLYFGLSLGLTFPLNILIGIPVYTHIATKALS